MHRRYVLLLLAHRDAEVQTKSRRADKDTRDAAQDVVDALSELLNLFERLIEMQRGAGRSGDGWSELNRRAMA